MAASLSETTPYTKHFTDHTRHLVALRLLPFLFVLYVINYLDRTSLAYAAIGMSRDLGFSDKVIGLGIGVFFISYVALQVPGALLVERWSARRMISGTLIAWGSLTALTALVHTPLQLYVARFGVGAAEAGFFPGVIVYLSHWFIREDRAKATSNFMSAIPLSFVIGSPLAGWTLAHSWYGFQGWRSLFVLEGMPAVLLGVVAYFYLTDWPREAEWLTSDQRQWIQETQQREKPTGSAATNFWQTLALPIVQLWAIATFFNYCAQYSFMFWFPTVLKRLLQLSDVNLGLLGAIPYAAAFILIQVNGWHSDKTMERRWHAAIPLLVGSVGVFALLFHPQAIATAMVFFTMAAVAVSYFSAFWAIPTETLSHTAAAIAVGIVNASGSVGGFVGPYLFGYLNTRMGNPFYGLVFISLGWLAGGLLILRIPKRDIVNG